MIRLIISESIRFYYKDFLNFERFNQIPTKCGISSKGLNYLRPSTYFATALISSALYDAI